MPKKMKEDQIGGKPRGIRFPPEIFDVIKQMGREYQRNFSEEVIYGYKQYLKMLDREGKK